MTFSLSTEELFERLREQAIDLDHLGFQSQAKSVENPEEFTLALVQEPQLQGALYPVVFELWKRLLPERESLSIFCDRLDQAMFLYLDEEPSNIQELLDELVLLLQEHVDKRWKPEKIFEQLDSYLVHDLEDFLHDYFLDRLDEGEYELTDEMQEAFAPYLPKALWLQYVHARVEISKSLEEGFPLLNNVIKQLHRKPDLVLQIEILDFLASGQNTVLFFPLAKETLPLLEEEEDLIEMLLLLRDFLRGHPEETEILDALETRKIPTNTPLLANDPDLLLLERLLDHPSFRIA